ncbi:MAG: ribonuclease P protein component [bacterium]
MKKAGFSKRERLKVTADYNEVLKKGEKVTHPFFYLYFIRNNLLFNRLGIRVGKRFGAACVRNRVKRIIREVYRKNKSAVKGLDLVFIPRYGKEFLFSDMEAAVKKVFLNEPSPS